jgi:CRP/FNR family transcriptional regulator
MTVNLASSEFLFSAGDLCQGLYIVLEGRTRAIRHGLDGREQVIHEDVPYSTFPEVAVFDDGPCPSTVIAVEDSQLLLIPRKTVLQFCLSHPQVAMDTLRLICTRLRKATGLVEDLSLKDVSQRLAEFLLKQEGASDLTFELKRSNQEIADLIGSVREVVSRAFSKLQKKGWIQKKGHHIELVDVNGLKQHIEGLLD